MQWIVQIENSYRLFSRVNLVFFERWRRSHFTGFFFYETKLKIEKLNLK
jgi:hypothetical protein